MKENLHKQTQNNEWLYEPPAITDTTVVTATNLFLAAKCSVGSPYCYCAKTGLERRGRRVVT